MLLEAALKLAGIDPAAFYALVGEARDTINLILDDPGAFAGHVIDAVKQGFSQFGSNFLTHLKDGVVQWLFGQMGEAGITIPARFDVAGVFDLVCQVLGLTYPRLRQKAVKLIGEKNVERIEFVWKYVQALITGGWAGLWEKIQQDLSSLWSTVIDGIKSYLMEKVVQQAILKIATMWNPAGAIIQLLITAWNVVQWVRENAQRIFALVQAVVSSMHEIAVGNITKAANFVEASLAKLIPIAISLLADLLGLGGLADKIKGIITKVQNAVDSALDKLIDRVLKMFKGGDDKDKDKAKVGDVVPFTAAGQSHKIWIDVQGTNAQVMVAEPSMPVDQAIAQLRGKLDKVAEDKRAATGALLDTATTAFTSTKTAAQAAAQSGTGGDAVTGLEQQLATPMSQLYETIGKPQLTKELSLPAPMKESHTLFAKQVGTDLVVEMASRRGVLLGLTMAAIGEVSKMPKPPDKLMPALINVKIMLEELVNDFRNLGEGRDAEAFVNGKLAEIATLLQSLGQPPLSLKSLENMGHVSQFAEGDLLLPEYQGSKNIRPKFYGSMDAAYAYRDSTLLPAAQAEALKHGGGPNDFWCPGFSVDPHLAPVSSVQVDHKSSVSGHWNGGGNNTDQATRAAWNANTGNFQLLCQPCNGRKGGDGDYTKNVGANFRGPGE
jgi:hypothetical protein